MNTPTQYQLKFAGIDYFDRAVFMTADGGLYVKSLELMPQPDFHALSTEEKESLLRTLCDTDEFEGEPGYPVHRKKVILVE